MKYIFVETFKKSIKQSIKKEEYYQYKLYPINQIEVKLQAQMSNFINEKVW